MHTKPSRRNFLRTAGATAITAPFVMTGAKAVSPNGKLQHASFGAAGMAGADIGSLSRHDQFQLVAVADVSKRNLEAIKKKHPDVRVYQDWRELLDKEGDKIDSVNVSTPDHMHGPMGLAALAQGKHVYGQKPLTQNLWECRQAMLRAREKGVMTQMGIQVSSGFEERFAVRLVQDGNIGKVKEVHSFSNKAWGDPKPRPESGQEPPADLDWDLWLGVAKDRPYIRGHYHPGNWRKRRDFGTGTLGDMGCHIFSSWFRALALSAPLSVKSTGPEPNEHNWAINGQVEYTFPGTFYTEGQTVKVTWYDGSSRPPKEITDLVDKVPGQGNIIVGTEGVLLHPHGGRPVMFPRDRYEKFRYPKLEPRNHYMEYVDSCLNGGPKPSANFEYAAPLTEAVLLGCVASIFPDETLLWDSDDLRFRNSEAATGFVKRDYRKGWEPV